jgi:hypothetical protein
MLSRRTKLPVRKAAESLATRDDEPPAKRTKLEAGSPSSGKFKLSSLTQHFKSSDLDLAKHSDLLSIYRVNIKNLKRHTEYQVSYYRSLKAS